MTFVAGITLYGTDQIGHQIGSPLVLIDDFRPRRFDRLIARLESVVSTAGKQTDKDGEDGKNSEAHDSFLHEKMEQSGT